MDGILGCCFPWSWLVDSVLLKHLCPKALMFFQNKRPLNTTFLPKELVVEILSRLPLTSVLRFRLVCKQWRLLTSTQSFIDMHENNQPTPLESSLVIQYFDRKREVPRYQLKTFFINEKATNRNKKFKMVSEYIELTNYRNPKKYYIIELLSSYKGFLVFTARSSSTCQDKESALIFYNPVTKEQHTVTAPPSSYVYCGFFFHSPTKEYRILYQVLDFKEVTVRFELLALRTKLLRKIYVNDSFSAKYYPDTSTPAVISNGALHWMVSEAHRKKVFGRDAVRSCSETILSFGMESEEFHLMPHPRFQGGSYESYDCVSLGRSGVHEMNLLEMEGGILCLCDAYSSGLNIYVMENYEKWTWVRRLFVPVHAFPDYWSGPNIVKALQIHQGELVVYYDSSLSPEEYMLYPMNQEEEEEEEEEEPDDASYKFIKSVFFGSKNRSKILEEEFECFDDNNLILKNKKKKEKSRFKVVIDRLILKESEYFHEYQTLRRIVIDHPRKRPKVTSYSYYTDMTQVALASVGNIVVFTPSLASLEATNPKPVTYQIE